MKRILMMSLATLISMTTTLTVSHSLAANDLFPVSGASSDGGSGGADGGEFVGLLLSAGIAYVSYKNGSGTKSKNSEKQVMEMGDDCLKAELGDGYDMFFNAIANKLHPISLLPLKKMGPCTEAAVEVYQKTYKPDQD